MCGRVSKGGRLVENTEREKRYGGGGIKTVGLKETGRDGDMRRKGCVWKRERGRDKVREIETERVRDGCLCERGLKGEDRELLAFNQTECELIHRVACRATNTSETVYRNRLWRQSGRQSGRLLHATYNSPRLPGTETNCRLPHIRSGTEGECFSGSLGNIHFFFRFEP